MKNNKLKLLAVVIAITALYGIIDAMPKHKSQPKKWFPGRSMPFKWISSKAKT
jgi:hypothetical protein